MLDRDAGGRRSERRSHGHGGREPCRRLGEGALRGDVVDHGVHGRVGRCDCRACDHEQDAERHRAPAGERERQMACRERRQHAGEPDRRPRTAAESRRGRSAEQRSRAPEPEERPGAGALARRDADLDGPEHDAHGRQSDGEGAHARCRERPTRSRALERRPPRPRCGLACERRRPQQQAACGNQQRRPSRHDGRDAERQRWAGDPRELRQRRLERDHAAQLAGIRDDVGQGGPEARGDRRRERTQRSREDGDDAGARAGREERDREQTAPSTRRR